MIQREFRPARKCGYKTASDGDIDIAFTIAFLFIKQICFLTSQFFRYSSLI